MKPIKNMTKEELRMLDELYINIVKKLDYGERKFKGKWRNINTLKEYLEEIVDSMNYLLFEYIKIKKLISLREKLYVDKLIKNNVSKIKMVGKGYMICYPKVYCGVCGEVLYEKHNHSKLLCKNCNTYIDKSIFNIKKNKNV